MGVEIERKFIVPLEHHEQFLGETEPGMVTGIIQSYLSTRPTVRLRIEQHFSVESAFLTIKGASVDGGLSRSEWEIPFPVHMAREIIQTLQPPTLTKKRLLVAQTPGSGTKGPDLWEVDILRVNEVAGRAPAIWKYLIVAEFEDEDIENVKNVNLPPWVGREVTDDPLFKMANLTDEASRHKAWLAAYGQ